MKAIFSMLLLAKLVSNALLSSVNFATYSSCSEYSTLRNPIGLTMDFPTVSPYFNDQLFQRYLLNSNIYGNWNSNFRQYIHVPVGYKYNCTLVAEIGGNNTSNCTYDIKNNTLLQQMGDYVYNTTQYYAYFLGWDMQNSNFADNSYLQNIFIAFVRDFYKFAKQPFSIELVDRGNLFSQLGIRENYTASLLVQDCIYVNKVFYGLYMSGPGTTADADSSWYAKNSEISYYCGLFTFRAVAFPNKSDLTISNLLSEKYTSQFLKQRLTINGTSYLNDLVYYYGDISDIRLVDDPMGVQGLTNSFAAGLWAIQVAMQFYYLSGARISFYNPMLNGSFQNIIGPGPTFTPTIMYSALLFTNIVVQNYPYVCLSQVKSGLSQNIKVYLLDYYTNSGILILNKDTNMNASGEVEVTLKDVNGLICLYFSAPNLSSTDGVTVGGLSITGSNSTFVGNYTQYEFNVDINGQYSIPVNYSQAVYCYSKVDRQYTYFPTGKNASGNNVMLYLGMVLIIFMMAI